MNLHRALASVLALVLVLSAFAPRVYADAPTYTVRAGDTLLSIARKFDTTVEALMQANGLANPDLIRVGQELVLPGANIPDTLATYTVKSGDSLYSIALSHGVTPTALADLNGLTASNIVVGQVLVVPSDTTLLQPGLFVTPVNVKQGSTVVIKITSPNVFEVLGTFDGQPLGFTSGAGFHFALVGISRCAEPKSKPITLAEIRANGHQTTDAFSLPIGATDFLVQDLTLSKTMAAILNQPALIEKENAEVAALVSPRTPEQMWSGKFRQPATGIATARFGTRRGYNGSAPSACGHEGMDIAAQPGTPVSADARGRVVFAGLTQVRGNLVIVDHGLGVYTGYYHLSAIAVKVGQVVERGDLVGKVGSTGFSTGAHLHWSMWVNGEYVDPLEWTKRVIP